MHELRVRYEKYDQIFVRLEIIAKHCFEDNSICRYTLVMKNYCGQLFDPFYSKCRVRVYV